MSPTRSWFHKRRQAVSHLDSTLNQKLVYTYKFINNIVLYFWVYKLPPDEG